MELTLKLGFLKKEHPSIQPQTNNFFLENSVLKHKKKSPHKEQTSFRNNRPNHEDFILEDEKELMLTDRGKKKEKISHKRNNSNFKKSLTNQNSSRQPTGVSTHISSIKTSQKKQKSKQKVNKNNSDLIKVPKKKLTLINNSSLGDEQSLKGSIPGWPGQRVVQRFGPLLNEAQKIQLINEKEVYYIGVGTGLGEDDTQGAYLWKKHEQLGFRYELLEPLGSGAFGEVVKAFDHKCKEHIAVKIIRSKKEHMQLALNEINILMKAKERDVENEKNILRIKDFIVFRKHICIVTELLSMSLYELLEQNNFGGIDMNYIRTFAIQTLNALSYLKEIKVVHSDLKPENVMLKNRLKTGIKLIDFGTSMFSNETNFLYIQSRFYRAPEVILNAQYDYSIDMWSFGCLLAELYLGEPIFAGSNEQQQLALIMEVLGCPTEAFLKKCKNIEQYFHSDGSAKLIKDKEGKGIIRPNTKNLCLLIKDKLFCEYLSRILTIEPRDRYNPLEALLDPWIIEGLPEEIKGQHLAFIKMKMKEERKNRDKMDAKVKKTRHKRQNTADIPQTARKSEPKDETTIKKHRRRVSDINHEKKFQDNPSGIRAAHLKHRRRGSAGIF